MAAPTAVRVEAESISTTRLRWTDNGTAPLEVSRSTDGSAYSVVAAIQIGVEEYEDTGLETGTKYWYKLSDDSGMTFSSVVTVFTHSCPDEASTREAFNLPRFDGDEQQAPELNAMAERIEQALGDIQFPIDQCLACPDDGAIVIDCSNGCLSWVIIADEDINSITIHSCGEDEAPTIDIVIPPSTSGRKVCGFPAGMGFTGDECTDAPLSSGAAGRTMRVSGSGSPASHPGYPKGSDDASGPPGGGGGTGGADCTCVPGSEGQLTIKSCNDNNSLDCQGDKKLKLIACGGRPPYTWTNTGDVELNTTEGSLIIVTPPANAGSAVAGVAYVNYWHECTSCSGGACSANSSLRHHDVGCDDVIIGGTCQVSGHASHCASPGASNSEMECGSCLPTCTVCATGVKKVCDDRTAPMIAAGCNPCGLQDGATVTVTDDVGTQATVILES